jgi:integral membrane sensor domain MASE1
MTTPTTTTRRRKRQRLLRLAEILVKPCAFWLLCIGLLWAAVRTEPVDVMLAVAGLLFLGPAVAATEEAILDWDFLRRLELWHDDGKGDE